MLKSIKNNQSAITLISLVITIMVLIILATVTVFTIGGDDGIIVHAKDVEYKGKNKF